MMAQGLYQLALRHQPGFTERLKALYTAAMAHGLWKWKNSYARFTAESYFVRSVYPIVMSMSLIIDYTSIMYVIH